MVEMARFIAEEIMVEIFFLIVNKNNHLIKRYRSVDNQAIQ